MKVAFERVLPACPDARLLLCGGAQSLALPGEEAGRYRARLEERVQQAGLGRAVRLTGYLADEAVSEHLAGADVGVLPFNGGVTTRSGSLLAMWAHGVPVVATRPRIVEPEVERAAHLVPCRDAAALADTLVGLLQSPSLRDDLAARARSAAASFSWQAIARRHLDLYERLLTGRTFAAGSWPGPAAGGNAHAR